jgi:hypothetical protein
MNKGEYTMNVNTKQILIAIAVAGAMAVTVAMAQTPATPTPAVPTAAAATAPAESGHKGRKPAKFEDRKARALQSLEKRAAKVQQQQVCVQAATDNDSLEKCRPPKRGSKGADAGVAVAPAAAAPVAK